LEINIDADEDAEFETNQEKAYRFFNNHLDEIVKDGANEQILKVDDKILELDGKKITLWADIPEVTKEALDKKELSAIIERDGKEEKAEMSGEESTGILMGKNQIINAVFLMCIAIGIHHCCIKHITLASVNSSNYILTISKIFESYPSSFRAFLESSLTNNGTSFFEYKGKRITDIVGIFDMYRYDT